MIYTASQLEAIEKSSDFLRSKEMVFRLRGAAGTGKSLISKKILSNLNHGKVVGLAPTHKACQQLRKYLGPNIKVYTTDSFLGLQPKRQGADTITVRSRKYDPSKFNAIDTVLLDEAFMTGTGHFKFIQEDIAEQNRQYIKVGDPYQLAPVGEDDSPLDTMELPEHCDATLTETHRFGGAILEVATNIRNAIQKKDWGKYPLETIESEGKGVYILGKTEWGDKVKELVKDPQYAKDPDFLKVMAYTNDAVIDYENRVAAQIGRSSDEPFKPGDRVVVNEALSQNDELVLCTGEDLVIKSARQEAHDVFPSIIGWRLEVQRGNSEVVTVVALDQTVSREAWKWTLEELNREAQVSGNWYKYYALKDYYADIRKGTSLTIHKMQGSQATNVALDYGNIFRGCGKKDFNWGMADRLLYTAITRATDNVYILMN